MGSMPRSYKRVPSEEQRIEGVERSRREYNGVVEFSSFGSQNNFSGVSSRKKITLYQTVICELL
jgi:hypothetical protein